MAQLVRHVRDKVQHHYWTSDGLYEQTITQFVFTLEVIRTVTQAVQMTDSDYDGSTSDEYPDCDLDDCVCSCED